MGLSENLQKAMKNKNLQAAELSQLSGVPASRISEIVTGRTKNPQMKTIQKLAESLGLSVSELTNGAKHREAHPSVNERHEEYGLDPLDKMFLEDWRQLDDVEKLRIWTLLKEARRAKKEQERKE